MQIRRLLIAGTTLALLVAAGALMLSVQDARESEKMDRADASMRLISHHASDLLVLAQDYALHVSPRAARQWRAVHRELSNSLRGLDALEPIAGIDRAGLKDSVEVLPELFSAVETTLTMSNGASGGGRLEALTDQLIENTRRVSDGSYEVTVQLAEKRHVLAVNRRAQALATLVLLLALFVCLAILIFWRVLRPIERLRANAGVVQAGDLSARLDDRSVDELGDLSRDFDAMTHTLQKREAALEDNARHTQAILDNVVDGIVTFDGDGLVSSFNRSAEVIFGFASVDVIGNKVTMLMAEPNHSELVSYLHNHHQAGGAQVVGHGREVQGLRKEGGLFPMDLAISNIAFHGQPLFIAVVRDITERKKVESMKNEFVSTVSHELRTPLTSITGALGLIVGGALGELPLKMGALLAIAHKNSLRLAHLIGDLLDMEKLVVGGIHFDLKAQALMPLIEQCIDANHAYGAQYKVAFHIAQRADGVLVLVDGDRIQQVLANLLSNAAKFSPEDGQVTINVLRVGKVVRVEVLDDGPGVPDAFRDRIFHKFSQADSSDTRQKGGSGLGLAISKELIERMNGMLGFQSAPGQGSSFYFELPVWLSSTEPVSALPGPSQFGLQ